MNETLHYRLTTKDWENIQSLGLKPSEKDLLLYLLTLNPFGDRKLHLGVRAIAREIGLAASTISRAFKRLKELGLVTFSFFTGRVELTSVAKASEVLPQSNDRCTDATSVVATQQVLHDGNTDIYIDRVRENTSKTFQTTQGGVGGENSFSQAQKTITQETRSHDSTTDLTKNPKVDTTMDKTEQINPSKDLNPSPDCEDLRKALDTNRGGALGKVGDKLLEKMQRLRIKPTPQVIATIKECSPSQIAAALDHIEQTFDTIKYPDKVFVYRAPKFPVQEISGQLPVWEDTSTVEKCPPEQEKSFRHLISDQIKAIALRSNLRKS